MEFRTFRGDWHAPGIARGSLMSGQWNSTVAGCHARIAPPYFGALAVGARQLGQGFRAFGGQLAAPSSDRRTTRGSFPLELAGGAGGRTLGAILEPLGEFREGGEVDLRWARPGKDAGDVEVGDGELPAEQ